MIVTYCFSSAEGDISLDDEALDRSFLLTPEQAHPHLTLRDYFDTLKRALFQNRGELLRRAFKADSKGHFDLDAISKIDIRSEKHGLLYHVSSVAAYQQLRRRKSLSIMSLPVRS